MSVLTGIAVSAALLITLSGMVAVLFAYFRKSTRDILREDNKDLRDRVETLTAAEAACAERLSRAEGTIQMLTDVVTGASAVAELKEIVDQNHQSVMAKLHQIAP